ncbi:MAG TPA: hypothetical protein VEC19_16615 [Usitatibacter sp.]|nr:hypothetical protein [Usitatibacter sp.]
MAALAWHYTIGLRVPSIFRDGFIRPADLPVKALATVAGIPLERLRGAANAMGAAHFEWMGSLKPVPVSSCAFQRRDGAHGPWKAADIARVLG